MRRSRAGFTLIELMVVVSILGVLAAIAIPSFSIYLRRSRSAEATQQLKAIFTRTADYYLRETTDEGIEGLHRLDCALGPVHNDVIPDDQKHAGNYNKPEWEAIGHHSFFGYFRYEIVNPFGLRCSIGANTAQVYTLRALGDLDADDTNSTFDLAVGSNEDNELYHARGFHIQNDFE